MPKPLPRFCEVCSKPLTWRLLIEKFNELTGRSVQYLYLACPTVKDTTGNIRTVHTCYVGALFTRENDYNIPDDLVARIRTAESKAYEEMNSTR